MTWKATVYLYLKPLASLKILSSSACTHRTWLAANESPPSVIVPLFTLFT